MPGIPRVLRACTRRTVVATGALLLAGSCAPAGESPPIPVRQEGRLVVEVVDSLNDAGRVPAAAVGPDGTPSVAYLLLRAQLREGEIVPPVIPGDPQPPAVIVATRQDSAWARTSVTPQSTSPAQGEAAEIANEEGQAIAGVDVDLAIDGDGGRHVAWSTPDGLFYATDAGSEERSFSEPERVLRTAVSGASITVDGQGNPWISHYFGNSVRAIHRVGTEWQTETVASVRGTRREPGRRTAIAFPAGGDLVVAFGDEGVSVVGQRAAGEWSTRAVTGAGGIGVSMDVDADGNPHLAYYDRQGNVRHAHSIGGGPWEVTDLASLEGAGDAAPEDTWTTGIGVDDQGNHYVTWVDPGEGGGIFLATTEGGLRGEPVEGTRGGLYPTLAVAEDGAALVLAWYDPQNRNLAVAMPAGEELPIAHSPQPREAPTAQPTPTEVPPDCQPEGTDLEITAPPGAVASGFDTTCLAVEAGTEYSVLFVNDDPGVPHNWALFVDPSATENIGGAPSPSDTITGPDEVTYEDNQALEPGQYFYRCDIHPTTMTGTMFVPGDGQAGGEGGDQTEEEGGG